MNLQDHRVTAGLSLSHLLIHDTRADCPIHANYRTPLSFGALAKPAVTVLLAIDNYKPKGWSTCWTLARSARRTWRTSR